MSIQIGVLERETLSFINCGTEYLKYNVNNIALLCTINNMKQFCIMQYSTGGHTAAREPPAACANHSATRSNIL
jgi:hypothetical protein